MARKKLKPDPHCDGGERAPRRRPQPLPGPPSPPPPRPAAFGAPAGEPRVHGHVQPPIPEPEPEYTGAGGRSAALGEAAARKVPTSSSRHGVPAAELARPRLPSPRAAGGSRARAGAGAGSRPGRLPEPRANFGPRARLSSRTRTLGHPASASRSPPGSECAGSAAPQPPREGRGRRRDGGRGLRAGRGEWARGGERGAGLALLPGSGGSRAQVGSASARTARPGPPGRPPPTPALPRARRPGAVRAPSPPPQVARLVTCAPPPPRAPGPQWLCTPRVTAPGLHVPGEVPTLRGLGAAHPSAFWGPHVAACRVLFRRGPRAPADQGLPAAGSVNFLGTAPAPSGVFPSWSPWSGRLHAWPTRGTHTRGPGFPGSSTPRCTGSRSGAMARFEIGRSSAFAAGRVGRLPPEPPQGWPPRVLCLAPSFPLFLEVSAAFFRRRRRTQKGVEETPLWAGPETSHRRVGSSLGRCTPTLSGT